jgi:hypothetical protein
LTNQRSDRRDHDETHITVSNSRRHLEAGLSVPIETEQESGVEPILHPNRSHQPLRHP